MRAELIIGLLDRDDVDVNNSDSTGQDRLDRWINQSLRHLTSPIVYGHKELQTSASVTLTATDTYDLSSSLTRFWATRWIRYTTKERNLNPAKLEDLDNIRKPTGPPTRWAMEGNTLVIDTTPGSAETSSPADTLLVRFWQRHRDLDSDNTTTTIPDVWDWVIIQGAVFYGWLGLGQAERADFARETFAAMINEVGEREDLEVRGEGHRFTPMLTEYQRT